MNEQRPNNFPGEKLKEEEAINMKLFRKELGFLISKRNAGEIKGTMFDLTLIKNINDLTEEDAHMWYRANNYESNPILETELESYQKNVIDSKNSSRQDFLAFIIQKITSLKLKKETKEKYG
jgi:hypothetical protein